MTRRWLNTILALCLGLLLAPGAARAQTEDEVIARITSPVDGQQLFGPVMIAGTARHPAAFDSFMLEYDDLGTPAEEWQPVQERVTQQVDNGVLGMWDTAQVPDGTYQLRLRVSLTSGEVAEHIVRGVRVANSAPTPVPTVPGDVGDAAAPTPGPSPTSPIQQPASVNPSGGGETGSSVSSESPAVPDLLAADETNVPGTTVNLSRVWSAFCTGGYITLAVFAVLLAYRALIGRRGGRLNSPPWTDDRP